VIFAILIFFIKLTLFFTKSKGSSVNLLKVATAKQQRFIGKINITVDKKGNILLNRQLVAVYALTEQLCALVDSNKEALVIINADKKVASNRVLAVMDQVLQVEGATIVFGL